MNLRTVALFVMQSLTLIGALFLLGFPIQCLVRKVGGIRATVVLTPLYGLLPLMAVSWIWSMNVDGGLHSVMWWLVLVIAVIDVVIAGVVVKNRHFRFRRLGRRMMPLLIAYAAALFAYVFVYRHFFGLAHQTPASLGNLDLAQFAAGAEHLRRFGLTQPGNVIGLHRGEWLQRDTTGTFILDLFPAVILDRRVWQTANATLFTGVALAACQLSVLLRRGFRIRSVVASVLATAAMMSPLVMFCIAHGYLSQLWSTALLFAGITVLRTMRRRNFFAGLISLACITSVLWYMYPLGVFLLPLLGVPLGLARISRRQDVRREMLAVGVLATGGVLLGALLSATRVRVALDVLKTQSNADAGWPLPAIYPHELLGFTSSFTGTAFADPTRRVGLIPVAIALVVAIALSNRRSKRPLLLSIAAVVPLATYLAVYLHWGPSYQQWKWAAYIAPLVIAFGVAAFAEGVGELVRSQRLKYLSVLAVVMSFGSVVLYNDSQMTKPMFQADNSSLFIDSATIEASQNPEVFKQDGLNIRGSTWQHMWLVAMLPDTKVFAPGYKYTPTVRVKDVPELVSSRAQVPTEKLHIDTRLNDQYVLGRVAPEPGVGIVIESVSRQRRDVSWRVRVINVSGNAWTNFDGLRVSSYRNIEGVPTGEAVELVEENLITQQPAGRNQVAAGESVFFEGSTKLAEASTAQGLLFDVQFNHEITSVWQAHAWN